MQEEGRNFSCVFIPERNHRLKLKSQVSSSYALRGLFNGSRLGMEPTIQNQNSMKQINRISIKRPYAHKTSISLSIVG